jgi:hypothetical protein
VDEGGREAGLSTAGAAPPLGGGGRNRGHGGGNWNFQWKAGWRWVGGSVGPAGGMHARRVVDAAQLLLECECECESGAECEGPWSLAENRATEDRAAEAGDAEDGPKRQRDGSSSPASSWSSWSSSLPWLWPWAGLANGTWFGG